MTLGLLLTALGLGLRHGIDWDHIAAIADLSSTAESRRRGVFLSALYAAGHAVVVLALGVLAIAFGSALPEGADVWMGRVVGATLVALGLWVLIELARKGRDFRLRSRWILVLGGTFAGLRRVRDARASRRLSVEHDHSHAHDDDDVIVLDDHDHPAAHDHAHVEAATTEVVTTSQPVGAAAVAGGGSAGGGRLGGLLGFGHRHGSGHRHGHGHSHGHDHSHSHRHETVLADSTTGAGNGTAAGIGVLHGIGFESPTQIAVFVASTSVVGTMAGLSLLVAWVVGLFLANTALSLLAAYGLLGADRNFTIYAAISVFVAVASLFMGAYLVVGIDPPLPALTP